MQSRTKLAATIRRVMRKKNIDAPGLAKLLGISRVMVEKLVCGDVIPSRHLQKQMKEALGISESRIHRISQAHSSNSNGQRARKPRIRKTA